MELEAGLLAAAQLAGHDHAAHQDGKDDGEQARSPERNPAKNANAQEDRDDQQSSQRNEKSKQNRSPRQNASRDENPRDKNTVQDESNKSGQNDSPLDIVSLRIAVLQPGGGVREFQLNTETPPGQQECKICAACRSELSKVWQEIHNAHGQIVKLQADKMVAIESKLTEKQLAQLQDDNPNHADHKKKTGETQ